MTASDTCLRRAAAGRRQRHDPARHRADLRRRGRRRRGGRRRRRGDRALRAERPTSSSPTSACRARTATRWRGTSATPAPGAHPGPAADRRVRSGRPCAGRAQCGAPAVLVKPFEPQMLVTQSAAAARRRRRRRRCSLVGGRLPAGDAERPRRSRPATAPAAEPSAGEGAERGRLLRAPRPAFANLNVPLEPRDQPGPPSHLPAPPTPAHEAAPNPQPAAAQHGHAAPSPARSLADRFETMLAVEQGELPASARQSDRRRPVVDAATARRAAGRSALRR